MAIRDIRYEDGKITGGGDVCIACGADRAPSRARASSVTRCPELERHQEQGQLPEFIPATA